MAMKRQEGGEQPFIPAGPFKIRLPFVHYKFEWPDYVQGLLLCTVCLSAIPLLTENLGMAMETALAVVVLNGILYCTHVLLGDPVVPGWVTPAIPLLVLYVSDFSLDNHERIQALMAFEMTLGVLAIVLGITGLGKKMVALIPPAMKCGLIMGAGIAAVSQIFTKGARFDTYPWTISICIGLAFFLLFSNRFKYIAQRSKIASTISNLGLMPVLLLAVVIGPLLDRATISWPTFEAKIFSTPDFADLWQNFTVLGDVPFPPLSMFIKGLPMVFSAYVVLFGEMVQADALLKDAHKVRPDETIDYNPNRSHLVFGIRNLTMSIIGPDITMCGPLWAAMQVVVCDRYKRGRKEMDSIHGGTGSFRFGTLTGYFLAPIVALVTPILGVGLALTYLIQGYVAVRVGISNARTFTDLGIAGVMGAVLATRGAAWGLAVGILLCLLIQLFNRKEYDDYLADVFSGARREDVPAAEAAAVAESAPAAVEAASDGGGGNPAPGDQK
ncbi:MAG: hypothetical protein LBR33_01760 [Propionibacteriaceae bacterium]|jgi:hypothetical protein|nr:hypothetical protein [Propionibacteriaceae bacterium]